MLLKYIPIRGLKTGCEVFCCQNDEHKSRPMLAKATAFILIAALLLFSIIIIISNGMSVLLSISLPSSYYQRMPKSQMFPFKPTLHSGSSKEAND